MLVTFLGKKKEVTFNIDKVGEIAVYHKQAMDKLPDTEYVIYWEKTIIDRIKDATPEQITKIFNDRVGEEVNFIGQDPSKPIGNLSKIYGKIIKGGYREKEKQSVLKTKERCYEVETKDYTIYIVKESELNE